MWRVMVHYTSGENQVWEHATEIEAKEFKARLEAKGHIATTYPCSRVPELCHVEHPAAPNTK